jgi:hypothetical protein
MRALQAARFKAKAIRLPRTRRTSLSFILL